MQKTLSIIIPAHNAEKFIERTMISLMQGIYRAEQDCEIILVNDSSTDNTEGLLQNFAKKHPELVKLFKVDYKNIGKVRNFAVQQSSGEYVTMLDCDDLILAGSLASIVKILQANKPELLLTKLREISNLEQIDKNWCFSTPLSISQKECTVKLLKHKDLQCHFIGQVFKRSLLTQLPFPEFICYEDAFIFPEIVKISHDILYTKNSFYLYLKNDDSLSRSLNPEKIKLLCLATENMDRLFFQEFHNLLSVHWVIIFEKYHHWLQDDDFYPTLLAKIKRIDFWSFLLDPQIRLSAKRKFFKVRRLLSFSRNN